MGEFQKKSWKMCSFEDNLFGKWSEFYSFENVYLWKVSAFLFFFVSSVAGAKYIFINRFVKSLHIMQYLGKVCSKKAQYDGEQANSVTDNVIVRQIFGRVPSFLYLSTKKTFWKQPVSDTVIYQKKFGSSRLKL